MGVVPGSVAAVTRFTLPGDVKTRAEMKIGQFEKALNSGNIDIGQRKPSMALYQHKLCVRACVCACVCVGSSPLLVFIAFFMFAHRFFFVQCREAQIAELVWCSCTGPPHGLAPPLRTFPL